MANTLPTGSTAITDPVNPARQMTVNADGSINVSGGGGGGGGGAITVADGADVALGTTTDANTVASVMGRLTKIRDLLTGIVGVQQADLSGSGTISAAQPVIGTPVSNATVQLALGQGQSTWKALLLAGGGGFTSATTIVADKSIDGGTTWVAASFKVAGSLTTTTVQSIVGPGPLELTGNAAGVTHVRIRCSVLNSTETIAVTLRGAAGVGDVGLLSSIPAGTNEIGAILLRVATGIALLADQSNTELRVSNYVKTTTAGDTALTVGQTTMANSLPVVIASDEVVPVKRSSVALFSTVQTTQGSGNSGDITVGAYTEVSVDITTSAQAGTNPTIQFFWERKGADGIYYPLWQSAVLSAAANTISTSIGAGMAYNQSVGLTGRLRWVVGGTATPTWTFTPNVYGK